MNTFAKGANRRFLTQDNTPPVLSTVAVEDTVEPIKSNTENLILSPVQKALGMLVKCGCIQEGTVEVENGILKIKDIGGLSVISGIESISNIKGLEEGEKGDNGENLDNEGLINKNQAKGILGLLEILPDEFLIIDEDGSIGPNKPIEPKRIFLEDIMCMRDGSYRIKNSNPHSDYKDMLTKNGSNLSLSYADKKNAAGYILQA